MTCHFCGLSDNTSTCLDHGNVNHWQPPAYLGQLGDPMPVSHTAGHQCLGPNDSLQHDTPLEHLSTGTGTGPDWTAALIAENNPFSIDHGPTQSWPGMSSTSVQGPMDPGCRYEDTTQPKEPSQPAKQTPMPTGGNKYRVKKTRLGDQRSRRPSDAHRDLKCLWRECEWPGSFSTKGVLMRHIETQHVDPWSFQCPDETCGKYFKREDNRDAHLRSVHCEFSPRS